MAIIQNAQNSLSQPDTVTKLEMCQYDTDAPAQGHPHQHAGILQKMKLKKGP